MWCCVRFANEVAGADELGTTIRAVYRSATDCCKGVFDVRPECENMYGQTKPIMVDHQTDQSIRASGQGPSWPNRHGSRPHAVDGDMSIGRFPPPSDSPKIERIIGARSNQTGLTAHTGKLRITRSI